MPVGSGTGIEADHRNQPDEAGSELSAMLQRLSVARQFGLGEPVLLHAVDESSTGDSEQPRGL